MLHFRNLNIRFVTDVIAPIPFFWYNTFAFVLLSVWASVSSALCLLQSGLNTLPTKHFAYEMSSCRILVIGMLPKPPCLQGCKSNLRLLPDCTLLYFNEHWCYIAPLYILPQKLNDGGKCKILFVNLVDEAITLVASTGFEKEHYVTVCLTDWKTDKRHELCRCPF